MSNKKTIVIDNGSQTLKAGFAGDDSPKIEFPTIIGRKQYPEHLNFYVGEEALNSVDSLKLKYPIQNGFVTNWDDMVEIWKHTFYNELKVKPEEHTVLLTVPTITPDINRENMTQRMFETFNTPEICIASQGLLSLYAYDLKTGVVIDSGADLTQVVPIYDGCVVKEGIYRVNFGGIALSNYLNKLLDNSFSEGNLGKNTYANKAIIDDAKEKLGYVALDFEKEVRASFLEKSYERKIYKAKDGREFSLGNERFRCAEALFKPGLIDVEEGGIPDLTSSAITKCNPYFSKDLYANIVLSGGSTMFPGLKDRLQKEIIDLAPSGMNVNVRDRLNEKNVTWLGGSKFASKTEFESMLITKHDYEEFGTVIVLRKCLN